MSCNIHYAGLHCKKNRKILHGCRKKGYAIGNCKVNGKLRLSKNSLKKCDDAKEKYEKKCGKYRCRTGILLVFVKYTNIANQWKIVITNEK